MRLLLKILAAVVALMLLAFAVFLYPYKDVVFAGPEEGMLVALTFDDGPHPEATPALLDELDFLGIKATFYLRGMHVDVYPELAREVLRRGHQLGNHSYHHHAMLSTDKQAMLDEVRRGSESIEEVTGCVVDSFRPPFMMQGYGLMRALAELELLSVGVSISAADWEQQDPEILSRVLVDGTFPGAILLLHDGDGDTAEATAQASRSGSVAAVPLLVNELQQQGYRFVTVDQLLGRPAQSCTAATLSRTL